jgi:hypothetical protein
MTLNQPDNENCKNCYYCISRIPQGTGIKGYDGIEIFSCHRNQKWHEVKITDWCGEWKLRN